MADNAEVADVCVVCEKNVDDELVILCDGCDKAFHSYCVTGVVLFFILVCLFVFFVVCFCVWSTVFFGSVLLAFLLSLRTTKKLQCLICRLFRLYR